MREFVVIVLALVIAACGRTGSPSPAAAALEAPPQAQDIASSDPGLQYFHEQLVINGEELQSDFGGYLLTLGMNPRDLQQDDPKHAYDTVMEKVRMVEDASLRRQMMLTFFKSTEPR